MIKNYVSSKELPQPLLFKIQRIQVAGNYCSFQALPVFKDGTPVGTDHIMDIMFDLCLKKTGETWEVIYDLSSTDVPSDTQLKQMASQVMGCNRRERPLLNSSSPPPVHPLYRARQNEEDYNRRHLDCVSMCEL